MFGAFPRHKLALLRSPETRLIAFLSKHEPLTFPDMHRKDSAFAFYIHVDNILLLKKL